MPPGSLTAALCLAIALPCLAQARDPAAAWRDDPIAITLPHTIGATGQPHLLRASYTTPLPTNPDALTAAAPDATDKTALQVGLASWYGGRHWAGRRTASGRRFNPEEMTAASATLPLGTRVLVTLESTTRSVLVTITDRLGTSRRIIDLSHAAARKIGLLGRGVARVVLRRG